MDDGVGVGVARETRVKGDGDAAQDEGTVGSEGVNVVAEANTHSHKFSPWRNVSARRISSWVVILILVYAPGKMATGWPSCSSREASSVTSDSAAGLWCA